MSRIAMSLNDFSPPPWLRPALLQTVLASARHRQRLHAGLDAGATRLVLDAGGRVRIPAWINAPKGTVRGRVVLLHGWLGTPQAGYVLSAAAALNSAGFETVRLTLPDHGEAALLTPEVVDLTRHDVIAAALRALCAARGEGPFGLVGFSLGGNFVLRIARDHAVDPVPGLAFGLAVSPVIAPDRTSDQIDRNPLIRRYFLRKFHRLAAAKQRAFPEIAGLDALRGLRTIDAITALSVARHTDYASPAEYYSAYHIGDEDILRIDTPLTLLVSRDDPIVPSGYALNLALGPRAERILTDHGGHNGFFDSFPHGVYGDRLAVALARAHLT